ncbi:MAG: isoleucine--tRNA ligase [Wigglesworthia glossinidia]|nr:isoleucine--tRNA ligase [Wigglesworthia glossinidia]
MLMDNYKNTLNLPLTKFKMRANLLELEKKILTLWYDDNLYNIIRKSKQGKKTFFLHDGPPYANGNIHIGHAVNKILKDIIIKFKSLSGYDAPYLPGWDCHGLPIELQVEKKLGTPTDKISAEIFRKKCRIYALNQVKKQKKDFIRLGVFGDWENAYLTMHFDIEANIVRTLHKIITDKYIYQGIKPVHWCIHCKSALAETEVNYSIKKSIAIDVAFLAHCKKSVKKRFKLKNINNICNIKILVWTTTPWTLVANRAIAVHANYEYALIQINQELLIIANLLIEKLIKRSKINKIKILGKILGKELQNLIFINPLTNLAIPLIISEHVTLDIGSGIVHIAPSYGVDDYMIGKKYNLEMYDPISPDGNYLENTLPSLDRLNIFTADKKICDLLNKKHALYSMNNIEHSYPYCWRHKIPTFFRATKQWFMNMNRNNLRQKVISEINQIHWIPNHGMEQIKNLVLNRPDWCISRQRTWGIPITLFVQKNTDNIHPNMPQLIKIISKEIEKYGIQIWWDLKRNEVLGKDKNLYKKVLDTLDVWFDSGATYDAILRKKYSILKSRPVDMYLEGSDQYRGWFMSSIVLSTAITGRRPCKTILTHGFVVDAQGRKMSKSIGNIISPNEIVKKFGADILRLWVASSDYKSDMHISEEIIQRSIDIYRRIRNTIRFLLSNIYDFDPKKDLILTNEMISIDQWALNTTQKKQKNIICAYQKYNFREVVHNIVEFCSVDMGAFYLDIIKDRQYTNYKTSLARRSCQTTLYHMLESLVRWIMPILSFTAHEVWQYIPGERSKYIFTEEWYKEILQIKFNSYITNDVWKTLIYLREKINKLIECKRKEKKIKNSLEAEVTIYLNHKILKKILFLKKELHFFFLVSSVVLKNYYNALDKNTVISDKIKKLKVCIKKSKGKKCARCWHYSYSIENEICIRCKNNISGNIEIRKFF